MRLATPLVLLSSLLAGCPSGRHVAPLPDAGSSGCEDQDEDGFGVGPDCEGPDCDDSLPEIHDAYECEARCADRPTASGCPCDSAEPTACYSGPEATAEVGICRPGIATCEDGVWSACDGEVVPSEEVCNEIDDDCDGGIDEGVTNECGGCGSCYEVCYGPKPCAPWAEGAIDALEGDAAALALTAPAHVIWPTRDGSAGVLRVDTQSFEIVGAYFVAPPTGGWGAPQPTVWATVATDSGDVFVTSEIWDTRDSWLTRIASDPSRCVDRDGDGTIETSAGWDDVLEFASDEEWDDECVVWHVRVGALGDGLGQTAFLHRGVGTDGVFADEVWVPAGYPHRLLRFDPASGAALGGDIEIPRALNYLADAAVDADGWIWFPYRETVVGFDPTDPLAEPVELASEHSWSSGIAIDETGTLWINPSDLSRWSDADGAFVTVGPTSVGAFAADGAGSMWATESSVDPIVYRIDGDGASWEAFAGLPIDARGLAADFDGHVWGLGASSALVFDVDDHETHVALDECDFGRCITSAGSDPAGRERRLSIGPTGSFSFVTHACDGGPTRWTEVRATADVPAGSLAGAAWRVADTREGLVAAPWTGLGTLASGEQILPIDTLDRSSWIEIRIGLEGEDGSASPTLDEVHLRWGCD